MHAHVVLLTLVLLTLTLIAALPLLLPWHVCAAASTRSRSRLARRMRMPRPEMCHVDVCCLIRRLGAARSRDGHAPSRNKARFRARREAGMYEKMLLTYHVSGRCRT